MTDGNDEGIIVPPGGQALEQLPVNELRIQAGASRSEGAAATVTFQREQGSVAGGVVGGVSQKQGWSIAGFLRKTFGRK